MLKYLIKSVKDMTYATFGGTDQFPYSKCWTDQLTAAGMESWTLRQLQSHLMIRALRSTMEGSSPTLVVPSLPAGFWLLAQIVWESTELVSEKKTGDDVCELALVIDLKISIIIIFFTPRLPTRRLTDDATHKFLQ